MPVSGPARRTFQPPGPTGQRAAMGQPALACRLSRNGKNGWDGWRIFRLCGIGPGSLPARPHIKYTVAGWPGRGAGRRRMNGICAGFVDIGSGAVPARNGHGARRCPSGRSAKSRIGAQVRRHVENRRVAIASDHDHRVMRQRRIRYGRGAEFRVLHDTGGRHESGGRQNRQGRKSRHLSKHTYSSGQVWPITEWDRLVAMMSCRP